MSAVGGKPVAPVEHGQCVTCRGWGWGPWVADLTAHIALVLHCRSSQLNTPQERDVRATMVGPHSRLGEDAMSGVVPYDRQGRWPGRRRGAAAPTRQKFHPKMPPPGQIPVVEEIEEDDVLEDGQNPASGGSGGIGGPKAPPAGPSTPPPPNPPPTE